MSKSDFLQYKIIEMTPLTRQKVEELVKEKQIELKGLISAKIASKL